MSRILIVDGHPDPEPHCFVHGLANAYAEGAAPAHRVRRIEIAKLDFPLIRSRHAWMDLDPPPAIAEAQQAIRWAEHIVFLYPLAVAFDQMAVFGFVEMVLFIVPVFVAYVYVWRRGGLDWD